MVTKQETRYFDFFAEAKHDFHYTATVMEQFFSSEPTIQKAKTIKLWSDGALRTKENLYLFQGLQEKWKVEIQVFIFPPYHGHSLADGHFGVGKKKTRKNFGGSLIASIEDVAGQFQGLHHTTTYIIPEIPHHNWNIAPLKGGIQCYFAFAFPAKEQVRCWAQFGETTPKDQQLSPKK